MDEKATQNALKLSQKAVYFDQAKRYEEAIYCYTEAANQLLTLIRENKCMSLMRNNVKECISRAEFLTSNLDRLQAQYGHIQENIVDTIEFLMLKAENETSKGSELYETVVEKCISAPKSDMSPESRKKLKLYAERALSMIEDIQSRKFVSDLEAKLPDVPQDDISRIAVEEAKPSSSKTAKYTKQELEVLSTTSNINTRLYVPFHSYDKHNEFKGVASKFTDPDGKIALTMKQKSRLKAWKRASELFENPCIISSIDSASIKQTVISDCSFISSLSIAALYEKKFNKRLVTSIIYPQDASGKPLYNPNGKYVIKFHINGVWRKVVVDDYFPCDENDRLMCSQSIKAGELWVSLLEKAYMKIMGGYDFPGSNSNIDLNALTGWIPERIAIRKDSPKEFDGDKVFRKLFDRMHRGDCLITLATGKMSKEDCDRSGLVDCHAYAVLDMRVVEGKRLFKVKNPWTHQRWKGHFSVTDKLNWTRRMKEALKYDPEVAAKIDDGVFWIDYESVINFFDVFYVNWNPELFAHTWVYHATWDQCAGPVKDIYTVGDNPQYLMSVNNSTNTAAVWILLTRHITRIDDFADNKEYITVMVYESGKKVYIPSDPKPISDGVRINSPHYLCQLVVNKPGVNKYTLVVAQYEKTSTIHYSLRVYSTVDFKLEPMVSPYTVSETIKGEWIGLDQKCDVVQVKVTSSGDENHLLMELRGPKQFNVAIEVKQVKSDRTKFYEMKNTGPYRAGYTALQLENVPAGLYYVKLATYEKQKGPYLLKIESTCKFEISKLNNK